MSKRVLVIGGGVVGLSTAYYAARRGAEVMVVERGGADRDGCSFGNAGFVVPSHFVPLAAPGIVGQALRWMGNPASPFYVRPRWDWDLLQWGWKFYRAATAAHVARCAPLLRDLNFASRTCYEEWAAEAGDGFGLVKKGLLLLCQTPRAWEEEGKLAVRACELGVPAEVLDARAAAQREPGVRMNIAGAVYFPKDCHLDPARLMAWLQPTLARSGVGFCWHTDVNGWRVEGRRLVAAVAGGREFAADEFVLCGGVWSAGLARKLGLAMPMQAGKGYSLTLPQPRHVPECCAILTEARVAVTPLGPRLRFGGTMELAGLSLEINPVRVRGIIHAVQRYYPDFSPADFADVPPWSGLRPCSPDGLPYLGRTARYTNLTIAAGHAMMGLSLGPISGKLVAALLAGEAPALDLALLSPDRYAR